jgi:hypothetical protein
VTSDPFHGIHRGCKVVAKKQPSQSPKHLIDGKYCLTHKLDLCSCFSEWEHAFIYAGKQINEKWAIIPLCVYHHLGEGLVKNENQRIALERATPEDLAKYPNFDWEKRRS